MENENKLELRTLAYVVGYVSSIVESPDRHEKQVELANELLDEIFTALKIKRAV